VGFLIEMTAFGQGCLSNYLPSSSGPRRLIFVLPTVEEFNAHMVHEYKKRINHKEKEFPPGWLQKKKSYDRRRQKKIQKITKCSKEILVLSVADYANLDLKTANLFD
jgi:hypothetical protein